MKNMDYKKKYNDALEWMRELYPGLHGATKEDAEHYFPELKESEENKDERIRKAIVELIKRTPSSMFDADTVGKWIGASHDEILAYLEKQKEPIEGIKGNSEEIPSNVDLEKEIDSFLNETGAPYVWCNDDEQRNWCSVIARHFYELGLKARKEEI